MWVSSNIEHWPISKLVPYACNARTHSDEQVAQIAASIAEFGFTTPILAGSDGVIIAGHGRLAAARKLGLEQVPVVVLDHLSPTQRKALVLLDNRIAENAGWDQELLQLEIKEITEASLELPAALQDELEALRLDLEPVPMEEQPRLDVVEPTVCPKCGHAWAKK